MDHLQSSTASLASDPISNISSPDFPKPRRVFTAPASSIQPSLQRRSSYSPPSTSEALVETLYNHPCVKIVAFTTATVLPASPNQVPSGTLSPGSRLERTIALGPFRIYRAPGSVAFLSCGSALQPILPKSQCWSIAQDNSRFILQIRRPQYWRLELPISGPEDEQRAVLLRHVFDTILLFEKTKCPFQRSFELDVALPDPPSTPVKKKAWTAEGKHLIASVFESDLSPPAQLPKPISRPPLPAAASSGGNGVAIARVEAVHDDNVSSSFGVIPSEQQEGSPLHGDLKADSVPDETAPKPCAPSEGHSVPQADIERRSDVEPESTSDENGPAAFEGSGNVAPLNLTRKRMSRMLAGAGRSFTAPPQLTLVTSPPSKSSSERPLRRDSPASDPPQPYAAENESPTTSTASFHSVQSWHSPITPLPPSPPSSRPESPVMNDWMSAPDNFVSEPPPQSQNDADCNTTPRVQLPVEKISASLIQPLSSAESTPTRLHSFIDKVPEQTSQTPYSNTLEERLSLRQRHRPHHLSISRRALSPLPSAANLFTPAPRQTSQSRLAAVRRLPVAIVQKTVEILLSPPSHLVNLMLKVAAKIAAGEWRGLVFGLGESGEQIPVQWDYISDGEFSNLSDDDAFLYTTAIHGLSHNGTTAHINTPRQLRPSGSDFDEYGSWEVD
ncbi:inheritance of peroxisomes protein 1-domain-containing protein [Xylariaceae sp. FL1019]|nr:inheritance of peroxisomes protein 1-domain-containing protein [Xylariaceae sp. FL1019]